MRLSLRRSSPVSQPSKTAALPRVFATVIVAFLVSAQSYTPGDLDTAFDRDVIVISASEHACYRFDIWLALSRQQHSRGLMYVRQLPADAGMLFVYAQPDGRSMWMKNTFLPLDMLFIRDNGTIASIVADTEPQSLRSIASMEPVTFVLELNAGTVERLHIGTNDQMYWSDVP